MRCAPSACMRILTFSKLLLVGGAAIWAAQRFIRPQTNVKRAAPGAADSEVADLGPDPGDPVQGFDEVGDMHVADLDIDVLDAADAEAAQDLASLESELDESALELDTPSQTTIDAQNVSVDATGELYGVHTPYAANTELPDGDASFDEGQNWIEALETSAVEYGAAPEEEVDIVDDSDTAPHSRTLTRDTPVADRGSGGPGGV